MGRFQSYIAAVGMLIAGLAGAAPASAAPVQIAELSLPSGQFFPGPITAGADGSLWAIARIGMAARPEASQHLSSVIDRIAPAGRVTEYPLPFESSPTAIAAGPDGNVWFAGPTGIGEISPAGQITNFSARISSLGGGLAAGPEGLWYTLPNEPGHGADSVGRIAADGRVVTFGLGHSEYRPDAIALGPDGNLWFTEPGGNAIGRIGPTSPLTEFPLPQPASNPAGIALGPDGGLWFTEQSRTAPAIGRIDAAGLIAEFPLDPEQDLPGRIVAGGDGRLWFIDGPATIGRITPGGRVSRIELPSRQIDLEGLAAGPEGEVWYTAAAEQPCAGAAVTCAARVSSRPGIVGHIVSGPLAVSLLDGRIKSSRRSVRIRVACQGGTATNTCPGAIRITGSGHGLIARGRYRLAADAQRALSLRLTHRGRRLLAHHVRVRVKARATAVGAKPATRSIILVR